MHKNGGAKIMLNKHLQRKVELESVDSIVGFKGAIELEYYLIESEIKDHDELTGKKAFGVEIVKKADNDIEIKTINNLSCCRENTIKLLDKLATNSVTPISLQCVIDDMIGM